MSKKFILAKKVGMTQIYDAAGAIVPVTVVSVTPNVVVGTRSKDKDGYEAVMMGAGTKKRVSKPVAGQLKDLALVRWIREFRSEAGDLKRGDALEASVFAEGDIVNVIATSKGKGFAGVVKRHGFAGGPASHGHPHNLRAPGSVGSRYPHIHKGKRMAGHMGVDTVTTRNLKVVKVDAEHQMIALKGAVPGARGTLVKIISA